MHKGLRNLVVAWGAAACALAANAAACFLSPRAGAAMVQDGKEQLSLTGPRAFDNCERVVVVKGVVLAQYLDKAGAARTEELAEGKALAATNFDPNTAPVRGVARGLVAVLTDPRERSSAGQKYFDKPAQIGAPFGDVYLPPGGLPVRFVDLEGDARVQITDATGNAVVLEAAAAQGMTLDRARFRAGGKYGVRVNSARGKLPPGAFEVVPADLAGELDQALKAIDADALLDADTRAIARALVFEREGLSFNRETALRELKK